jgi:hypothetical protein
MFYLSCETANVPGKVPGIFCNYSTGLKSVSMKLALLGEWNPARPPKADWLRDKKQGATK